MSKKTSPKNNASKSKGANVILSLDDSIQKSKPTQDKIQDKQVTIPVATKQVVTKSSPVKKPVKTQSTKKSSSDEQTKLISSKVKSKKQKSGSKNAFKLQKVEPNSVVNTTNKTTLVLPHEHESYFVYLKSPLEYRRHLLESSRKILYSLKGYQKIVLIRQKKLEEMRKLRNSVKELIYLNKKFNEMLPKYNMPLVDHHLGNVKQAAAPVQKVLTPVPARKPVPPREKTEIEKLEESLANIEKKLRTLQ